MREAELAARQLRYDHTATEALLARKRLERTPAWFATVESHRTKELARMKMCFDSAEYNTARQAFVHKAAATATPDHLLHPWPVVNAKNALVLEATWDGSRAGDAAAEQKFVVGDRDTLRAVLQDEDTLEDGISARFPIE
jgi:hypothetical protein